MKREPSSCSCPLPQDMYGFGGWHQRQVGARYWANRIWNLEFGHMHDAYRKTGKVPDVAHAEIMHRAERMPSTITVEICPHYLEKVKDNIGQSKAARAAAKLRKDPEAYF